jgi:hypothetical protein
MRTSVRNAALIMTVFAFSAPAALANPLAPSHNANPQKVYSGSMIFSGALKGTLKITPTAACTAGANGVQMGDFNTKLSPSKATNWSVTVLVPGSGTFRKFQLGRTSFVLATSGFTGWVATSGWITVKGDTGKVNLVLGAHEGAATGVVHVKGGWSC